MHRREPKPWKVSALVSDRQLAVLNHLSREHGLTKSQLVGRLIDRFIDELEIEDEALAAWMRDFDEEIRLGTCFQRAR